MNIPSLRQVSLKDKYILESGQIYASTIQMLTKLPLVQGVLDKQAGLNTACFISGYRGSPLGGLDKSIWQAQKILKDHNIHFTPGVNEELGATAVWGSQQVNMFEGATFDGVYGMWYGKGPGVDRSGDVFRHANAAGTSKHGGVLVVAGDDHACRSSTLPHQTEYAFIDAMIPVLNPSGIQDIFEFGLYGWALSRFSGCWVTLKTIEETADSVASLPLTPELYRWTNPEFDFPKDGVHIRFPDTPIEQEFRLHNHKIRAVKAFAAANPIDKTIVKSKKHRIGIITTGKSFPDLNQALEDFKIGPAEIEEIGLSIYKIGLSWPIESNGLLNFTRGLEEILIIEEKRPVIEDQIKEILFNHKDFKLVLTGKRDESGQQQFKSTTELLPTDIAPVLAKRFKKYFTSNAIKEHLAFLDHKLLATKPAALQRIPYYCAGCPHNTSTVVPDGSRALAGIGCHYMVTWMDRNTATFTQMGGEGVPWLGQSPFTDTKHVYANLGDGTYFHSGILAIRQAISAKVNITYKLLYNDAVAMTGGQPLDGELSIPHLTQQLRSEGVERIALVSDDIEKYKSYKGIVSGVTIAHRDDLEAVQLELRQVKGTSVLIYDQTCAAEKRRRRKRGLMDDPAKRVFINELVCEGCGDCGKVSNCVSIMPVETEFGRKRAIDQSSCNKDYSCVNGFCPSFVTIHGGELKKRVAKQGLDNKQFTKPKQPELNKPYDIIITGIGGTGVVTIGALIGMAAHLERKGCTILDITGLAQKGGQVTSHVRIAQKTEDIHAVRVSTGNAHLVIGSDMVVTSNADVLEKMRKEYTNVLLDTREAMTGDFTRNPDMKFPKNILKESIKATVGDSHVHEINAYDLCSELLGDAIYANCFLLGYACQKGLLPVSSEALEKAIELNGVSIKTNIASFEWGRMAAQDYDYIHSLVSDVEDKAPIATTYEDILQKRVEFLTAYQNKAYAKKYQNFVEQVRNKEQQLGIKNDRLSKNVAKYLFKLMSYKDEYEVARLYTDGTYIKDLKQHFDGDYKLKFHLAPPLLSKRDPVTGNLRKKQYGGWIFTAFKIVKHFKILRGTIFDVLGYSAERKMERNLIVDYRETMEHVLGELSLDNYDMACKIAAIPENIRGFGHVKIAHLEAAQQKQQKLLDSYFAATKDAA
jgi:indolepyruvate ferredoxin oxidoreductase